MAISFEAALGVHEAAFKLRAQRAEVLANNMANVDTPNYKARDLDFKQALARQTEGQTDLSVTHEGHIPLTLDNDLGGSDLLYRTPNQPSIDGNTVEEHVEHAEYMKNALDFQASFTFLNGSFRGMLTALRGE